AVLDSVAAQFRKFAFEVRGDDEHARQIEISVSGRSLLWVSWSAYVGTDSHGSKVVAEPDERITVARLKYGRFRWRHRAVTTIATCTRRKSPEMMLCVKLGGSIGIYDEGTD